MKVPIIISEDKKEVNVDGIEYKLTELPIVDSIYHQCAFYGGFNDGKRVWKDTACGKVEGNHCDLDERTNVQPVYIEQKMIDVTIITLPSISAILFLAVFSFAMMILIFKVIIPLVTGEMLFGF